MKIAIIQAKWNSDITNILLDSCEKELLQNNIEPLKYQVAGAVELPIMALNVIKKKKVDAVICIGVVIKGETDHYDHVANQASYGCQKVALTTSIPVVFGVLTTPTKHLALVRANGEHSNSGQEWAQTAIELIKNIKKLDN